MNEEIKHAIEEGIEFINLASPIEYFADENGMINKMRVQKMELSWFCKILTPFLAKASPQSFSRKKYISILGEAGYGQ